MGNGKREAEMICVAHFEDFWTQDSCAIRDIKNRSPLLMKIFLGSETWIIGYLLSNYSSRFLLFNSGSGFCVPFGGTGRLCSLPRLVVSEIT